MLKNLELSIIIITLDEEKNLPRLLRSIKKQKYKNYEIIVSDAGSRDKTKQIARKANCKIVQGGLPGRGRNNGAKAARGEYLLFLDADGIIPKRFLENIIKQAKENNADIAVVNLVPLSKSRIDRFFYKSWNLWQKAMEKIDPHSAGSCILIKKSVFKKVGGFDERIKLAEDHALARKAFKSGAKYKVLDERIFVSTRRMKKEGRSVIAVKYVLAMLYRAFIGEIKSDLFKYNMKNR